MTTVAQWYLDRDKGNLTITSPWGDRDGTSHKGCDIAHYGGSPTDYPTPVPSESSIEHVGYDADGWGNYVVFRQTNQNYKILIAHLNSVNVIAGQIIPALGIIGGMGNTGGSNGTHWHIEVMDSSEALTTDRTTYNPESFDLLGLTTVAESPLTNPVKGLLSLGLPHVDLGGI
jgi:murein DD-endopeptidase MepM/ murein hydrolase activator NlpD